MSKSQPLKDPAAFLKDLIVRKGESQQYACVFYGANLLFNPEEHSHSDTYTDTKGYLLDLAESDDKYRELVTYISHSDYVQETYRFPEYFGLKGVITYVEKDAHTGLRLTFCFPQVNASRFGLDVEILSHIALLWSKLSRAELNNIRVFIDAAFLRWEDMEEENLLYTEYESN